MVSPRRVEKNNKNKGNREPKPHKKYCFYLDVKNNATAKKLEARIKQLGLRVEVFLTESVTHVISDAACSVRRTDSHHTSDRHLPPSPAPHVPSHKGTRRVGDAGARSRADAMLERVHALSCHTPVAPSVAPAAPSPPVLSVLKALKFLDKLYETVHKAVSPSLNVRHLKGAFVKFESFDRATRPVFKELSVWPDIATEPDQPTAVTAALPQPAKEDNGDSQQRMTRKSRLRVKEREEAVKQSGYCEMCHADYADLAHHEKSAPHLAFIKNGANFLALDTLIRAGADVEAFLGVNEHASPDGPCERRSLRKIIKIRAEHEDKARVLEVICNGTAEQNGKTYSPRESCRRSVAHKPQVSPALSTDSGHFLRSKGPQDEPATVRCSPREAGRRDVVPNGAMSPRAPTETAGRANGTIEEDERLRRPIKGGKKSRSIRWRRPSPEATPPPQEDKQYYKVVGVSTKLRSSGGFQPAAPKDEENAPRVGSGLTCNGEPSPLVVKFRRMRRSELSVLSDEAEQFMFPKRDDSTDTEDEVETATSGHERVSSDVISSDTKRAARPTRLKEESSGDETSQDGFGFDFGIRRKCKRKKPPAERKYNSGKRAELCKQEPEKIVAKADGDAECGGDGKGVKTESKVEGDEKVEGSAVTLEPVEKCLKWEEGRLKASPEVESLEFAFERVPHSEAWYETFKRQDDDKQISKNVSQCFATYMKSPKLPYEMGQLPALKPDCCPLSGGVPKRTCGPARAYGTRGMKKKRVRQAQLLALERNPRKSPREHASTLAILGSLLHKRKVRPIACDDAKSVASVPDAVPDDDTSCEALARPDFADADNEDRGRRLEEFLSAVFEDAAEYEVPTETMDVDVRVDPCSSRPDVVGLLAGYEDCDAIDIAVREMQEDTPLHTEKVRRRGHKTKKKNKTGWPRKKKLVVKKVRNGRSHSASSDKTDTQGDAAVQDSESSSTPSEFSKTRKLSSANDEAAQVNENSITSVSDAEDKGTVSSRVKDTDTEASDSEDDTYLNSVDLKRWESAERSLGDRLSEEPAEDSLHSLEMQPIVRVQKMETEVGRRLRSSASDHSNNNKRRPAPQRRSTRGFWYAAR